ncbi:MAG: hypothetical protein K2Q12_11080 [Rickettsiales bacterium]|nr:hypothetical protein [Rickettsiales bacterium]
MLLRVLLGVLSGLGSAIEVTSSPLYRSPHRHSAEALRGDWLRIGKDIDAVMATNEESDDDDNE